jgi:hypothetical protein
MLSHASRVLFGDNIIELQTEEATEDALEVALCAN